MHTADPLPNVGGSIEEYYCHTIYIQYTRILWFSPRKVVLVTVTLHIFIYTPYVQEKWSKEKGEFKNIVLFIQEIYKIENLVEEALVWYDVQNHKGPLDDKSLGMIELLKETTLFPAVCEAIFIAVTDSACNIMYSGEVFSAMCRVKIWLRSTMSDERLSSLCVLSIHRDNRSSQITGTMNRVIDNFGRNSWWLQFLL